ncbi:MAG: hypothetical protein ACPGU7_08620 [Gammaproteobacteria bacterium]
MATKRSQAGEASSGQLAAVLAVGAVVGLAGPVVLKQLRIASASETERTIHEIRKGLHRKLSVDGGALYQQMRLLDAEGGAWALGGTNKWQLAKILPELRPDPDGDWIYEARVELLRGEYEVCVKAYAVDTGENPPWYVAYSSDDSADQLGWDKGFAFDNYVSGGEEHPVESGACSFSFMVERHYSDT